MINHTTCHIFTISSITFHHLIDWFKYTICSLYAISADITDANAHNGKYIRGYSTKLVWNSVKSTFNAPSNLNDAVTDDRPCANNGFTFVYTDLSIPKYIFDYVSKSSE